jgi:hypothetical protein
MHTRHSEQDSEIHMLDVEYNIIYSPLAKVKILLLLPTRILLLIIIRLSSGSEFPLN